VANGRSFEQELDAELENINSHGHRPGLRPGESAPKQPQPARPPDRKDVISGRFRGEGQHGISLKGGPGSAERLAQLRKLDPDTFAALESQQRVHEIGRLLDRWSEDDWDPELDDTLPADIAQAAFESQDMNVVMAARAAVMDQAGEEAVALFDARLNTNWAIADQKAQEEWAAAEEKKHAELERNLTRDYEAIQKKLGRAGLEAGAEVAEALHANDLLYHPLTDSDQVRDMVRASAEVGRAQERARGVLSAHMALDEEFKRRYGPRGSDAVREQWRSEVDDATVETYMRAEASAEPDVAAARAIASRNEEAQKTSSFEQELDAELERRAGFDSRAPHRQEMARSAAEDWKATHDELGRPRQ